MRGNGFPVFILFHKVGTERDDKRLFFCYSGYRKEAGNTSPEEILNQLKCIATADVTALLQVQNGSLTVADTEKLPPQLCAAIASVEKGSGGIKIKFYDKLKALELLGKHAGLWDGDGATPSESPLLQTLLSLGKEDASDISDLQPETEPGDDLVEPSGNPGA